MNSNSRYNSTGNAATGARLPKRRAHIRPMNNFAVLFFLCLFELVAAVPASYGTGEFRYEPLLATAIFCLAEILYLLFFYGFLHRRNFELEFIAFFLCSVGFSTVGSIYPDAALKQCLMALGGIVVFIILVFLLGNTDLCMKLRLPVAIASLALLAVNLVIAQVTNGARNWIEIAGITFQPSEFVKIAFIFVGAMTLEKIQTSRNIYAFIAYAVVCVGSLILIRDFGTALIFFVVFLIIAFMTSGDIRTILAAIASGILGAAIVIRFRSYVTARFSVYRHIWEADYYNTSGYQQTRTLVGMASGGLLGLGIGQGNVRNVYASSTDLIFGVICEEWGYLFAIIVVLAFVAIAVSALVNSIASRSSFYSVAAVAGAGLLLFQAALNIFGITDILPLTGVTLPFISQGGSSMICCWGILAFIKASDIRTYNYLSGGARKK